MLVSGDPDTIRIPMFGATWLGVSGDVCSSMGPWRFYKDSRFQGLWSTGLAGLGEGMGRFTGLRGLQV